ncbi:MAG: integration host factor subunit beta [Magnetococcales bacterium]|nr:integration host factor subunit beta [Magnetococcales bacterium]
MTRSELIDAIALKMEISRQDAAVAVKAVFDTISASLTNGNRVELRGFGCFGIKERQDRTARNPKTGVSVEVEAKRVVFFKAGKELRQRVDV